MARRRRVKWIKGPTTTLVDYRGPLPSDSEEVQDKPTPDGENFLKRMAKIWKGGGEAQPGSPERLDRLKAAAEEEEKLKRDGNRGVERG